MFTTRQWLVLVRVFVSSAIVGAQWGGEKEPLAPRVPLPKEPVRALLDPSRVPSAPSHRLVVKFADGVRARATADGELSAAAGADLAAVRRIAAERGLRFSRLIDLPDDVLDAWLARARDLSGREQPDLAGIHAVEVPGSGPSELAEIGSALQALDQVEYAYVEELLPPPPGDISPPTPDFVGSQTYRGSNPGLDVGAAWALGIRGAGVRLSDCEYGWNAAHEDLVDTTIHAEPGQTPDPLIVSLGYDEHGTAVLGETSAVVNIYGCSGLVPDAAIYTYPEYTVEDGARRVTAISNAIASSAAGDVVLLEMQVTGAGGGYGPAELDLSVWTVTKAGTDAGVIVVAAAGNGSQDLDGPAYASYRARGDSGAIIVGAGSPDTSHAKLGFSTYGARVNVQGWGGSVFTLGYGDITYGGDKNQRYTVGFGGTSSASPFVASACVALEQFAKQSCGAPLSPLALRGVLVSTGIPQGAGGHIGPFPDLEAALASLCPPAPYCTAKVNSQGCTPAISSIGTPSASSPAAFDVRASNVLNGKNGLLLYGYASSAAPFQGGTMCIAAPRRRTPVQTAGGNPPPDDCSGYYGYDFNARIQSGVDAALVAGEVVFAQYWTRDSASPSGTGLSDALRFTIRL